MRVAVVGSGAAAVGVLQGLMSSRRDLQITVFDIGKTFTENPRYLRNPGTWGREDFEELYGSIRADHGRRFPPPKTHFGHTLPRYGEGPTQRVFRSELLGGMTNFWGGTMLPFTKAELAGWPVGSDELRPYYREIAELVGISGRQDGLNRYFPEDFANRPAIRPISPLSRLDESVNRREAKGSYDVVSGLNRVGLETRTNAARQCIYCGECMSGCFTGSVYSAKQTMDVFLQDRHIQGYVKGKVLAIDPVRGRIDTKTENGTISEEGFEKIFLSAGCAGTTEIAMRSLGLREGPQMEDNAVYVFPIFSFGKPFRQVGKEPYLALSNLILGCIPRTPDGHFAQAQIYPSFDYLWRYYVSPSWWSALSFFASVLRARVFWVRLYMHGNHSPSYSLRLDGDELRLDAVDRAPAKAAVSSVMRSIRSVVNSDWFYIPPVAPMIQKTSAHYAASLPYGKGIVDVGPGAKIERGVYVCDSACFPDSPAVSPTFTIMANACRIAREALND